MTRRQIFLWNSLVYKTNIDWVDELTLTAGELVGVIHLTTKNPSEFNDLTANHLPIGTEIYTANERNDLLIAKHDGELRYLLVEG